MKNAEYILRGILDSEGFDDLVAHRLKSSLECQIEVLEEYSYTYKKGGWKDGSPTWQDYVDTLFYCRALIKVLEWFTVEDYTEDTVKLNGYRSHLEGLY